MGFSTIYFLSNFWMFGDIGQGLSAINVFSPLVTITSCSSGLSVIQHSVPWKIEAKKNGCDSDRNWAILLPRGYLALAVPL